MRRCFASPQAVGVCRGSAEDTLLPNLQSWWKISEIEYIQDKTFKNRPHSEKTLHGSLLSVYIVQFSDSCVADLFLKSPKILPVSKF